MEKTRYYCVSCGEPGLMVDDTDDFHHLFGDARTRGATYHCKACATRFSFTEWG